MSDLSDYCWPMSGLDQGLQALAQACGYAPMTPEQVDHPPTTSEDLNVWLHQSAAQMALEVQSVTVTYDEVFTFITRSAPAYQTDMVKWK